jgi:hypothetical protein
MLSTLALVLSIINGALTLAWDPNPPSDNVTAYRVLIDQTLSDVGDVETFLLPDTLAPGQHAANVFAVNATAVSPPSATLLFTVPGQAPDPCLPPFGVHAPALFPSTVLITSGRPGSLSNINYTVAGPDAITDVVVLIDDVDQPIQGHGTDLTPFTRMSFTQPAVGSHSIGLRITTSFGCVLIKHASAPLIVKP